MIHVTIDEDLDATVYTKNDAGTQSTVHFLELNKEGCHKDCDGCYEPGNKLKCFRCRKGLRLVELKCLDR
jgi:hypothetical protein